MFAHFPFAHHTLRPLRSAATAVVCSATLAGCASLDTERASPASQTVNTELNAAPYIYQAGWLAAGATTPAATAHHHDAAWWQRYQDDTLNQLMADIDRSSPTLAQAQARWRQAQAIIGSVQATAMPQVGVSANANRSGNSGNFGNSTSNTGGNSASTNQFRSGLSIGWALDLWGRNAMRVDAAQANANAAQADIAAARLALQLSTAESYVQLRTLELQEILLKETLTAYQRALELTTNQYQSGFVARADVIQAQTQLQSVRTQLTSNARQHALSHNAIATLTGTVPSALQIAPTAAPHLPEPAAQPAQLPSELLLRRPDLVAAQQLLVAANAELGVAQRAWLPDIDLNASGTLQASSWSQWLNAPLRIWSIGPSLAASLFDGGTRQAATAQAQASLDSQTAVWRGQVLQAIREVEDALASSAWLQQQHQQQAELVALATENLRVMQNQYDSGLVSYLDVAIVQNQELSSRRTMLDLQADRLLANMQLLAALGGHWSASELAVR